MSQPYFQQEPSKAAAATAPYYGEHASQNVNDQVMGNHDAQPQTKNPDEDLQKLYKDMLNQMTGFLARQDIGHAQEIAQTLLLWPEVPSDYHICAHALLAFGRPDSDHHPTNSVSGLDGEVMARFFDRKVGKDEQNMLAETCNALRKLGQR